METARIEKVILTDNSIAWNVVVADDDGVIVRIGATTARNANAIARQINAAAWVERPFSSMTTA